MVNKLCNSVLNILRHQKTSVKNTVKYYFMSTKIAAIKRLIVTDLREDMEQLDLSIAAGRIKLYNHFGDVLSSFQANMYLPMTQQFHLQVFYPREMKLCQFRKKICKNFQIIFIHYKSQKQETIQFSTNYRADKPTVVYLYEMLFRNKKKCTHHMCNNKDKYQTHYTE